MSRHSIETMPLTSWAFQPGPGQIMLAWLGQAGFLIRGQGRSVLVDPYLSDSLAAKYRGKEYPHVRMMPPPVSPDLLREIDWVLCSHAHSDHMDPGTLPPLAAGNPSCRFVVPRAEMAVALSRGVPPDRLVGVNAGERVEMGGGVVLEVIPSAHEELTTDEAGQHRFLGFILRFGDYAIYHSGDCVPFAGQAGLLAAARVDLALLPVNGRDAFRSSRGILGNFTFREAVELCVAAGIPALLAHHVGMFDFNTLSPEQLRKEASAAPPGLHCILSSADAAVLIMADENALTGTLRTASCRF
ncbi:MAG: MBL fold metallo-hydrolase [Kiritimatiellia bacterium]